MSCIWLHVLWGRVCKQRSKVSQRTLAGSQRKGGANLPARGCSSHTGLLLQDVRWNPDIVLKLKATLVACPRIGWTLNLYAKKIPLPFCLIFFSCMPYFKSSPPDSSSSFPSLPPFLLIALWALVLPFPMNTDWLWRDSYPSPSKLAK